MTSKRFSALLPDSLIDRVLAISRDPETGLDPLKGLLLFSSLLYGVGARRRARYYAAGKARIRRLACRVVSIGNLTVGGTGKTPMAIHLAREFEKMGLRPAIVSRGYKGTAEKQGAVVSDGRRLTAGPLRAGDEPYLMASLLPKVPVIVGADRYVGGSLALERFQPDVIVLDDAFQHMQLHRDLNIVLLDAVSPLGNGYLLPRGPLREPVEALRRADAIVFTRADERVRSGETHRSLDSGKQPIFYCRHAPVLRTIICKGSNCGPAGVDGRHDQEKAVALPDSAAPLMQLFAFSGLARNERFIKSLSQMGGRIRGSMSFPDHYAYRHADMELIRRKAIESGADCLATTDKDYVRLPTDSRLPMDLLVFGVDIDFGDDLVRYRRYLERWLEGGRR